MNKFETFTEWLKKKSHDGHRPVPVKNPGIDSFLAAVDNLKRDMEELDAVEKKVKAKPKKKDPDKPKKTEDKPKKTEDKPKEKEKEKEDDEKSDILDDVDDDRFDKPVRLSFDKEVPIDFAMLRRKPNRPNDFRKQQLGS